VDDVTETFGEQLAQLQRITDGAEGYGEGTRYEQGTRYYLKYLVDECAQRARAASPGLPDEVDLLISMTGHSPRLTVLAYRILRPRRLVMIPSEQAEDAVNTIYNFVSADGRLRASDISIRMCVPTDPLGVYNIVKDELDIHARRTGAIFGETFIDITAGRKVMGAAAALAAWQLDVKLCYIDGEYVDGRALPGSDRLLLLDNPSSLFGEHAMAAAEQAFVSGAFETARNRFDELADRLARPSQARFMASLSALYRAWCDLDLAVLPVAVGRVRETIGPVRRGLPHNMLTSLYAQLDYLHRLWSGDESALLLCFSLLADHYQHVGRHDFAALFSYRTIEGCFSTHLATRHSGFARRPFDYDGVGVERQVLTEAYRKLVGQVRGQPSNQSLPRRSGVFSGAVLLAALGDPLAELAGLAGPAELRELWDLAEARNQSVLAHGTQPVHVEVSQMLHVKALAVLRAYWSVHYPDDDLDQCRQVLAFVRSGGGV
jgi:CRISPR-associated protein (TIGR02710 family)